MEQYRKDRGRFYFSKKRIRLFFFCWILVFIISFSYLRFIDERVKIVLKDYLPIEVERLSGYVVREVVKDISSTYSSNDFVNVVRNRDDSIERIVYSNKINDIRNKIASDVDKMFYDIESGNYSKYNIYQYDITNNKYKYIRNGFLCELSSNSLQKSTLFGNLGPNIPIKISFVGYSFADISINTREYGINNVIIEIIAEVEVNSVISMPISVKKSKVVIKEPIITEIVPGNIPNYYLANWYKK